MEQDPAYNRIVNHKASVMLVVGSLAEADCVFMKYIVAIVGLPDRQRL